MGGGNVLAPANASDYPALFDEQSLYPERASFRNSMYFDEIYHGRTAYEFLNGLTTYETTHPPLGKIFIAAGVALFGMNPFGWRIAGTVLGILMVPVIYLFGKKLTENTPAAALSCVLFAFDFMHFTQTRIATIDVYVTFFVLLMYFFLYCYSRISFYDTPLSKTFLPLGACGVCMGLGIACKWTGIYAGAGLALIFFAVLFRRYREYRYARSAPEDISNGISHRHILKVFLPCTVRTLAFCVLFFVGIPALIYLLSYLPFRGYAEEGLFARMLHSQTAMFHYHSTLDATHPYSSPWYQWPVMKRPVWYYSSIVSGTPGAGGLREGISAFGNPLVWWPGIPAALYMLRLWILKKDRNAAFLLTGYLAQYLPWSFVTRITFTYHYFPSVAFVTLMIVYGLLQAKQWAARSANCPYVKKRLPARGFPALAVLYGTAVFLLFLLFYPVLSGQAVDAAYVAHWLRWSDSWVLTAP
ncbi:MAG: phospholipid carrier-dependent glycosyltransferase [Eubacterium sp.]|nr:phospholipid carrier-dependent glycosyltransferase [Eubacterium sp.]MCM1216208.1 phospholipid carrier-dependent glycosyltransferase [Lachnospiraceae bacterium]MCM1304344.1 phospholipid carrier-dependent glycosyltransferase [Butyrivibrio sp.]MCM1344312.1 phospholipid carrier-dependent glycosyltransferase [Muribaculaceae bacterium]MCM1238826.1 phospholipid carrier-dependent glycosyltransferase [Lachnospiraceae bacterium]